LRQGGSHIDTAHCTTGGHCRAVMSEVYGTRTRDARRADRDSCAPNEIARADPASCFPGRPRSKRFKEDFAVLSEGEWDSSLSPLGQLKGLQLKRPLDSSSSPSAIRATTLAYEGGTRRGLAASSSPSATTFSNSLLSAWFDGIDCGQRTYFAR